MIFYPMITEGADLRRLYVAFDRRLAAAVVLVVQLPERGLIWYHRVEDHTYRRAQSGAYRTRPTRRPRAAAGAWRALGHAQARHAAAGVAADAV